MRGDDELQQDVLTELRRDPRVEPRHIGVEVERGVVTLTGTVTCCARATAADAATRRVPGVRDVLNRLQVALPDYQIRSDGEIRRAVDTVLDWDAEVPRESVQARVVSGIVTLEGEVEHEYQREVAERAVRHLRCVRGVVNRIAVKTPLPRGIRRDVAALLDWPTAPLAEVDPGSRGWGIGGRG
ncbi:MAG TPA: BON domain-containing protein [Chloroflexota bacterium]|nr:BON domain-containing protein [Chloroflexota bacterium]